MFRPGCGGGLVHHLPTRPCVGSTIILLDPPGGGGGGGGGSGGRSHHVQAPPPPLLRPERRRPLRLQVLQLPRSPGQAPPDSSSPLSSRLSCLLVPSAARLLCACCVDSSGGGGGCIGEFLSNYFCLRSATSRLIYITSTQSKSYHQPPVRVGVG